MRAIPDDNLSYPVLITLTNGGTGSGFFLNTSDATYLVTAKHVFIDQISNNLIADEATLLSLPRDPTEDGQNIFRLRLVALQTSGDLRLHPSRDILVVRIGIVTKEGTETITNFLSGVTTLKNSKSGILGAAPESFKKFSEVLVANEVFLFGYPTSLGLKELPQINFDQPLLRRGIVAGLNKTLHSIILDCPVYPGNSGGPVVQAESNGLNTEFKIIGVVSQFVPFVETWVNTVHQYSNTNIANSGYSVVTPIEFALELL